MKDFYAGRNVCRIFNGENSCDMDIWHMDLEEAELGHMSANMEKELHFLCVLRGTLTCQINQEETELKAGEGLFVNQESLYRIKKSGKGGSEFLLFALEKGYAGDGTEGHLTEKYITPVTESESFPYLKLEKAGRQAEIVDSLLRLEELAVTKPVGYELELKSVVYLIWTKLYREFVRLAPSLKKSALRETAKLSKMLKYLHGHYKEKLTLGEMAEDCRVSSGEYCRFFKKHMGQTPFEYLQAYRIEQSLPKLLEKSGSITDVALQHGFGSSSYYAETFKKEMGCAPGDYRKWYLKKTDTNCPLKKKAEETAERSKPVKRQESMPAHLL